MIQHKTLERPATDTPIIHIDWPMARWSRNVSLRRGDRVLPYRSERRQVATASDYPDGDAAALSCKPGPAVKAPVVFEFKGPLPRSAG